MESNLGLDVLGINCGGIFLLGLVKGVDICLVVLGMVKLLYSHQWFIQFAQFKVELQTSMIFPEIVGSRAA
jgi:hypothetical protein